MTHERKRAGLTKAEAARQVGITPQLLGLIEAGKRNATPPVLRRLAKVFNCPIVVLERKRTPAELYGDPPERGAA